MTYAEQILREILTEEANLDSVTDAIKKRYEVELTYKADNDPKGSGMRVIQPVVLGHSKSGNLVLRAFQPYGDTKTKRPAWKMFRLDRIEDWKPNKGKHFSEPPGAQFSAEGKYNPKGDGSMVDVLVQANFGGAAEYAAGTGKYKGLKAANDRRAAEKRAKDPFYDLRKNIKKSYNANNIDYIKKNIEAWKGSEGQRFFQNGGANTQSASEMSQVQNFGDDVSTQTVGPVTKNNTETRNTVVQPKYNGIAKNGPVYKNTPEEEPAETNTDNEGRNNEIEKK